MLSFLFNIFIFPIYAIIEFIYQNVCVLSSYYALLCIFAVSFFVNLICLPMYNRAELYQREEREIQKKLEPKVKSIKKNFKGDEQFMLLSTYYRQNNYHPIMALRSSLSLLIQIPFFIAAYTFFSQPQIYGSMSVGIIKNLSVPDGLLNIFGISINILPVLMTLINVISAEIYAKGIPAKERMQMHALAFVFLVLLYNSPSGLVIYWTLNNCFSLLKNIGLRSKDIKKFFSLSVIAISAGIGLPLLLNVIVIQNIPQEYKIGFITLLVLTLFVLFIVHKFKRQINEIFNQKSEPTIFVLTAISMFFIIGIFVPSIVISSSPEEFSFLGNINNPLYYIFSSGSKAFGMFFVWSIIFYCFFENKIKNLMTAGSLAILFSSLVNILMFRGNLGLLSVDLTMNIYDAAIFKILPTILNSLVSICAITLAVWLFVKNKIDIIKKIVTVILLSTIFVSGYNTFSINKNYNSFNKNINAQKMFFADEGNAEIKPIFELSKSGKNVMIIFLDRAISAYLPVILDETTELKEEFTGFTYYPNCVSYFGHTILAYPSMIAGYEYTPEKMNKIKTKTIEQKFKEALLVLPLIFKKNGFSETVLCTPIRHFCPFDVMGDEYATDKLFNEYKIKNASNLNVGSYKILPFAVSEEKTDFSKILKRNFFYFSVFVTSPTIFKKNIYTEGSYIANNDKKNDLIWDDFVENEFLKLFSLPKYTAISEDKKNTFTIFNSECIHINFYQKPFIYEHLTLQRQAMKILGSYMKYLKENEVYDNTRIIIVSDHGHWGQSHTTLRRAETSFNPVLFVKDFNKTGSYTTDNTFMTNADAALLSVKGVIEKPINPFTGKNILNQTDKKNVRILYYTDFKASQDFYPDYKCIYPSAKFYKVSKNIFEPDNWISETK